MARRPKRKPDTEPSSSHLVLPMQLQVGDRFTDETGEWEIVSRPGLDATYHWPYRPGAAAEP
jgi:hypothetical protein